MIAANVTYFVDARYPGQAWDLRVYLDGAPTPTAMPQWSIERAFHEEHDRRNGTHDPDSRVEIITWGVRVEIPRPEHTKTETAANRDSEVHRTDSVVFGGESFSTQRYRGVTLEPGDKVVGPAVIDQPTTTIVVPPEWNATLDERSNIYLTRKEA